MALVPQNLQNSFSSMLGTQDPCRFLIQLTQIKIIRMAECLSFWTFVFLTSIRASLDQPLIMIRLPRKMPRSQALMLTYFLYYYCFKYLSYNVRVLHVLQCLVCNVQEWFLCAVSGNDSCMQCLGMIYPEFRSRTPPPTYIASMMEYEDCRRPRRLSCGDVETVPDMSTSEAVEPVPATPPPAYRSRVTVRGLPVYCPRALRSRPHSFVTNDLVRPTISGSTSAVIERASQSSEFDIVGKCIQIVGRGMTATSSLKPESSVGPSTSVSRSNNDCHVASCSSDDS